MRTSKEIDEEIWRLRLILPRLPQGFFCDNRKAVKAESETLETGECPGWIYESEDGEEPPVGILGLALDAEGWREGKRGKTPSEDWASLTGFVPQPVAELEKACGVPASEWAGQCSPTAIALQKSGLALGEGTTYHYGHWTGPIDPRSMFKERPFTHHAWLQKGDQIIDPTRWVFENCEPYIYVGKNDHYDDGGQDHDMSRIGQAPKPEGEPCLPRPKDEAAWAILKAEGIVEEVLTENQAFHLANLPPKAYPEIRVIHTWLESHNLGVWIPMDYVRIAKAA
jgi:hypothetical protein